MPKKRHYYIETIEGQYAHAHNKEHLCKVREIIKDNCNDYLDSFDKHMNERSGHMFNMFIMRNDYFDEYSQWIFNILFQLENRLEKKDRILGFVGERLLDIWLIKNKIPYIERKVVYIEKQYLLKKYFSFIKRALKN